MVLKPSYSNTVDRGIGRVIGTTAGAVLATSIAAVLRPGPGGLTALTLILAFAALSVWGANYALYSCFLTGFVVFLVALNGLPPAAAIADRAVDNVIGATLAVLVFVAWPTWESAQTPELSAQGIDALTRHVSTVLTPCVERRQRGPNGLLPQPRTAGLRATTPRHWLIDWPRNHLAGPGSMFCWPPHPGWLGWSSSTSSPTWAARLLMPSPR